MEMDTLQDTMQMLHNAGTIGYDVWFWIAVVEFVIIIILLFSKKDSKKSEIRKKVLNEGKIDFGNIIKSSFHAEQLYNELMRKCHPDLFAPDDKKMRIANEITMRISKNKNDLKELEKLREEAINKLNIKL